MALGLKVKPTLNPKLDLFPQKVSIDHAIGFDVIYHNDWKELHLFRHYNDFADTVKYALLPEGKDIQGFDESHRIQIPVKHFGHYPQLNWGCLITQCFE